jgi:hypothetical protein
MKAEMAHVAQKEGEDLFGYHPIVSIEAATNASLLRIVDPNVKTAERRK